jgi:hypothetical protein
MASLVVFFSSIIDSLYINMSTGLGVIIAELGAETARFISEVTSDKEGKTKNAIDVAIDINIKNQHPAMKLGYVTRFTFGGGCTEVPDREIHPEASATIQLKSGAASSQLEGVLLYRLAPNKSVKPTSNNIYLVLAWKVTASSGLHVHMTLIEHNDDSVSLGRDEVEKYYRQLFGNELRKLDEAIKCSWFLNESIPFTISMTVDDSGTKIDVEIKEGKSEAGYSKPM